jgi:hypothetical protein
VTPPRLRWMPLSPRLRSNRLFTIVCGRGEKRLSGVLTVSGHVTVATALQSDVPTSRKEALLWSGRYLTPELSTMDLTELVKPTLACLEDRT